MIQLNIGILIVKLILQVSSLNYFYLLTIRTRINDDNELEINSSSVLNNDQFL